MTTSKVLFVDCDGVRLDRLLETATPHLDALAERGQFGPSSIHDGAMAPTLSGPGHANLLTGVWPDKHGVVDNTFDGARLDVYPGLFDRLRKVAPHLSTFSSADWQPLNDHLIGAPHVKLQQLGPDEADTDRQSTDDAVAALTEADPDVLMVYLHDADATGHRVGSESAEYAAAVERVDSQLGRLVAAVQSRPTYGDEAWLWVVATDHGQIGNGHGGDEPEVRTIWLLAAGRGIPPGSAREWRQVDVVPTILKHLGVPVDPSWGLDGIPIGVSSTDPFDEALGDLPPGWTRDSAGWRLTTGPRWCISQPLRGRGSFVRGRDVIAVADSASGAVDSTLWSPWIPVSGGELTVEYAAHYRHTGDLPRQLAKVLVEVEGAPSAVLWSTDSADGDRFDVSAMARHVVPPTDRPGCARIGWWLRAEATNGYWAIDAFTVRET